MKHQTPVTYEHIAGLIVGILFISFVFGATKYLVEYFVPRFGQGQMENCFRNGKHFEVRVDDNGSRAFYCDGRGTGLQYNMDSLP